MGDGHLTAVYSDDSRITAVTHSEGIQHLYFRDYTADYIASTSFRFLAENGDVPNLAGSPLVGMNNFFTAQTQTPLLNGVTQTVRCFVHPEGAVVLSVNENGLTGNGSFRFQAVLKKEIKTDQSVNLRSLVVSNHVAVAAWSNGTVVAIASRSASDQITVEGSTVSVTGKLKANATHSDILLIPALSEQEALSKIGRLQQQGDIEAVAHHYWDSWMDSGKLPVFKSGETQGAQYLEAYKRNLYCVRNPQT